MKRSRLRLAKRNTDDLWLLGIRRKPWESKERKDGIDAERNIDRHQEDAGSEPIQENGGVPFWS